MKKVIQVFNKEGDGTKSSNPIDILGAKRVTLVCKREDHSAGSSTFSAEVGVKGALATYERWLTNATNTNEQGAIRDDDLALSGDASDFITMSEEDVFETIKLRVITVTDGKASAWLIVDYADDIK